MTRLTYADVPMECPVVGSIPRPRWKFAFEQCRRCDCWLYLHFKTFVKVMMEHPGKRVVLVCPKCVWPWKRVLAEEQAVGFPVITKAGRRFI